MSTSSIRRNTVFSSINMIFFNYTGKAVFKCISSGRRSSLLFWQKGNIIFVEKRNTVIYRNILYIHRMYRKCQISMCFWERPSFIFLLNNKVILLGKRSNIVPDNGREILLQCSVFENTIFSVHLEKIKKWFFVQCIEIMC